MRRKQQWPVLKQHYPEGCFPIAYASRFPNEAELKHSTNELELLVRSMGHRTFYILFFRVNIRTNHRKHSALIGSNIQ